MPPSPGYINGPLVIPQTCEVKLVWSLPGGRPASNVFHAIIPDGFALDGSVPTGILDEITGSSGWAALHPFLAIATSLVSVVAKDLRVANLGSWESDSLPIIGTSAADALPTSVAMAVSLHTAQSGRSFRGRVYLGGFTEDATDSDGHGATGLTSAVDGFVTSVAEAMTVVGLEMALGHRGHAEYVSTLTGRTIPAEAAGSVPVTRIRATDNVFDSQRRRK